MAKETYQAEQLVKVEGTWYGPGRPAGMTVKMNAKDAEPLLKAGALSRPGGNAAAPSAPPNPYADWNKEKLAVEAEARELEVKRADGKEGDPLVSDYEKALLADDAAKGTTD